MALLSFEVMPFYVTETDLDLLTNCGHDFTLYVSYA